MRKAMALMLAVSLAGCVSTQLKRMVGLPVQEAAIEYGLPVAVFDMPDGRRVFQFSDDKTFQTPMQANTTASTYGNVYTSNTTITGGYPATIKCTHTFYTEWDEAQGAWMVTDFKMPKGLVGC